jgi:hypothetical protein
MLTGSVVPTLAGPLQLRRVPGRQPRLLVLEASECRLPFER